MNEIIQEEDMELVEESSSAKSTKKIAVSAVLGALSIALASTSTFIPRLPGWGIAVFDPVSIIWIIAFLIGGIEVGILTTYAGFFGLFLFDPTGVGPVFKFLATIPLILIPWIIMEFSKKNNGAYLSSKSVYTKYMFAGYLVRLLLMTLMNLIMVPILYGITDIVFILEYSLILNTLQTIWDTLIPFLIVYRTPLFKEFRLW